MTNIPCKLTDIEELLTYENNNNYLFEKMKDNESELKKRGRQEAKFWVPRQRNQHNQMERKRRLTIKKQVKKLQECIPEIKHENGRRFSRISVIRKASSYIDETREGNSKLRNGNLLLQDENMALERQISELLERQQASEATTETEEIVDSFSGSSDSDEYSSLFNAAVNFEADVTEVMMDDIINSQSEFWLLSKEFE